MKLSESQRRALESLRDEGPVRRSTAFVIDPCFLNRTMVPLEERGLVRYFRTSDTWRITPFGKSALR